MDSTRLTAHACVQNNVLGAMCGWRKPWTLGRQKDLPPTQSTSFSLCPCGWTPTPQNGCQGATVTFTCTAGRDTVWTGLAEHKWSKIHRLALSRVQCCREIESATLRRAAPNMQFFHTLARPHNISYNGEGAPELALAPSSRPSTSIHRPMEDNGSRAHTTFPTTCKHFVHCIFNDV